MNDREDSPAAQAMTIVGLLILDVLVLCAVGFFVVMSSGFTGTPDRDAMAETAENGMIAFAIALAVTGGITAAARRWALLTLQILALGGEALLIWALAH